MTRQKSRRANPICHERLSTLEVSKGAQLLGLILVRCDESWRFGNGQSRKTHSSACHQHGNLLVGDCDLLPERVDGVLTQDFQFGHKLIVQLVLKEKEFLTQVFSLFVLFIARAVSDSHPTHVDELWPTNHLQVRWRLHCLNE